MNAVERHLVALSRQQPDRVPVAPSLLVRPIRRAGVKQYDYHTNPQVLAQAQIDHCEAYDFDGLIISSDNVILYEALGGKIVFPDDHSYPFWTDPLLAGAGDLARLKVPDPARAGRMPVVIEAARLAAEKVGRRRFIMANIDSGPFQLASTLLGMERAMTMLAENPGELGEILRFCAEVAIVYGTAMARTGCHAVQFGESTAGIVGRKGYQEVIFPHDCRVVAGLKKTGVKIFLHVCGDSRAILDLLAATGADCLEIDSPVDMARAKQQVGGIVTLKGNVDTGSFVTKPKTDFLEECRQVVEASKPGGGFILCGGCEVPADASDEILRAFREAADLYGRY